MKNLKNKIFSPVGVFWSIATITFIGAILWSCFFTLWPEGYVFRRILIPDASTSSGWNFFEGPEIASLSDAWLSWKRFFFAENGRLTSMVNIFATLIPDWIMKFLCGCCTAGMFVMLVRMAKGKSPIAVSVCAVVLLWTAFPWYNFMCSTVFQVNYTWSSLFVLIYLALLPRMIKVHRFSAVGVFIVSGLLGMWHEGFATVTIAYVFVWAVFTKNYKRWQSWVLLAGLVCGLFAGLLGGVLIRLDEFEEMELSWMLQRLLSQVWVLFLAVAVSIVAIIISKPETRRELLLSLAPAFVASIVGLAQCLYLAAIDRALWPCQLFAVLLCLRALASIDFPKPGKVGIALICCFIAGYAVWISQVVRWQKIYYDESETIYQARQRLGNGPAGIVGAEISNQGDSPWWLMNVVPWFMEETHNTRNIAKSVDVSSSIFITLPTDVANMPFDQLPSYPGTLSDDLKGIWPSMISRDSISEIKLTFGDSYPRQFPLWRWLGQWRERRNPAAATFVLPVKPEKISLSDSTSAYILFLHPLPRTLQYRQILSIDKP